MGMTDIVESTIAAQRQRLEVRTLEREPSIDACEEEAIVGIEKLEGKA